MMSSRRRPRAARFGVRYHRGRSEYHSRLYMLRHGAMAMSRSFEQVLIAARATGAAMRTLMAGVPGPTHVFGGGPVFGTVDPTTLPPFLHDGEYLINQDGRAWRVTRREGEPA